MLNPGRYAIVPTMTIAILLACVLTPVFGKQECLPEVEDGICFCHLEDVPEGPEENSPGGPIVFFVALAFFIGVISRRWLKAIPYTVQLYLYGMILGQIALMLHDHPGVYHLMGISIAEMDPRLMLTLFLPILLFETAFFIDLSTFRLVSVHAALLAGPGCVITTALMAIAIRLVYPTWTWGHAALVGAILSATDPVAVVAILKEVGASKKTSAIIEGESLVNDAVAILLFDVLHDYHRHGELAPPAEIATLSVRLVLGGPVVGWAAGRAVTYLMSTTFNDALVETTATFAGAYLSYYIAENFLGSSGVLTMVSYGLVLNYRRSSISPEVEHFMDEFWHIIVYFANTLIFIVVGIQTRWALSEWSDFYGGLGKMSLLFLALNLSRFFVVYAMLPLFNLTREKVDWRNAFLISFGGIRGAVALALAMEVAKLKTIYMPADVARLVTYHVGGLVMLSIVANGLLTPKVIELLGIADIAPHRRYAMRRALGHVRRENERHARMLQGDAVLADAPWDRVEYETADKLTNPWEPHGFEDLELDQQMEMSRVQVLRALKLEVWQRYRDGLARQTTIRRLQKLADRALHFGESIDQMADHLILQLLEPPLYPLTAVLMRLVTLFPLTDALAKPKTIFSNYDVGFNFMQSLQALQDRIPHLCAGERSTDAMQAACSQALAAVRRYLQKLDLAYPKVTQGIKMRAAARTLLNADRKAVKGLIAGGLIEEDDGELLVHRIEICMRRLEALPMDITLSLPEQVLSGAKWFRDLEPEVQEALLTCKVIVRQENDCIQVQSEAILGLGVVVHGVVRVTVSDPPAVDFLGPGQAFNTLGVITGQRSGEAIHAHTPQTSYYWFPIKVIQELIGHWPHVKRDLMRSAACRLCAHILSRYLPYVLSGKSRTLANVERGWLLNLQPISKRDAQEGVYGLPPELAALSGQVTPLPVSPRSRCSSQFPGPDKPPPTRLGATPPQSSPIGNLVGPAWNVRRAISVSGANPPRVLQRRSSAATGRLCHAARLFPRPQRVASENDNDEQVLVALMPQYEYVLLYGRATTSDGSPVVGPCVVRSSGDWVGAPQSMESTGDGLPPTVWLKFSADSWLVAVPRFEVDLDEEEPCEDDPRGSPLAGSGDVVDYSLDKEFAPEDAPPSTLRAYIGHLISSPRHSRHDDPEEGRMPLMASFNRFSRRWATPRTSGEPLPDRPSHTPSQELVQDSPKGPGSHRRPFR